MKKDDLKGIWRKTGWVITTIFGSVVFALGFSLFLEPHDMNSGGISGLAQSLSPLTGIMSIGFISVLLNLPLFIAGGIGLAPMHSVINYCRHYRDRYGKLDIVYGSRSQEDPADFRP